MFCEIPSENCNLGNGWGWLRGPLENTCLCRDWPVCAGIDLSVQGLTKGKAEEKPQIRGDYRDMTLEHNLESWASWLDPGLWKMGTTRLLGQWVKLECGVQSRSCLYIGLVLTRSTALWLLKWASPVLQNILAQCTWIYVQIRGKRVFKFSDASKLYIIYNYVQIQDIFRTILIQNVL